MTPKWYVLQVNTGTEIDVAAELQRRGYWAVVPIEGRMIRRGGTWIQKPYVVFSGYVFIFIDYSWAKYYALTGIKGVIKILGGGKEPTPLFDDESEIILKLTELLISPSEVAFNEDGSYTVVSGFLKDVTDNIVKIDKHAKRAIVKVTLGGNERTIKVSIKTYSKIPERTED